MPKTSKRKGKQPDTQDDGPKPYDRVDVQTLRSHSQQPESSKQGASDRFAHRSPIKSASQPPSEQSRSQRRKENKRRNLPNSAQPALPTTTGVDGAHSCASSSSGSQTQQNVLTPSDQIRVPPGDTENQEAEAVRQRLFPRSVHQYATEAKELRRKVARMTKAEAAAAAVTAQLHKRIEELEKTVASQKEDAEKTQAEIEAKTKLISDHGTHADSLKEHLLCGVCFEALNDPHILSCGHTACRKCLQDWFRSPNAYPAADIEVVNADDDLTYRTKVCHMCRERIFRRPTRMFIVQQMVDLVGMAPGARAAAEPQPREEDSWDKVFPPEPKTWLVRDEDDGVSRCPQCGCEVDYGECTQCGATFSGGGSDVEMSDVDSDDAPDRIDLGDGLMMDRQFAVPSALDEILAQYRGLADNMEAFTRNMLRMNPALRNGLVDDEAEDDETDDDETDDDETDDDETGDGVDDETEDHDEVGDDEEDDYNARLMGILDNAAALDEDDGTDNGSDSFDGDDAVPDVEDDQLSQNDIPPPSPQRHSPLRRRRNPLPPPRAESVVSDGSYESSFINDDDSDDAIDARDASNDAGADSDLDEDHIDIRSDASQPDEPTIDELRQRRAARYAPPVRLPTRSPSIEILEEPPVRRAARRRVIESDDDE